MDRTDKEESGQGHSRKTHSITGVTEQRSTQECAGVVRQSVTRAQAHVEAGEALQVLYAMTVLCT